MLSWYRRLTRAGHWWLGVSAKLAVDARLEGLDPTDGNLSLIFGRWSAAVMNLHLALLKADRDYPMERFRNH